VIAAPVEIEELLRAELLADSDQSGNARVLHQRTKGRGGLLRLPLEAGGAMVVKIWHLRTIKDRLKSRLGISNGCREWCMHRLIHDGGLHTPAPLGFLRLQLPGGDNLESMAIEDLGETMSVREHLTSLMLAGEEDAVRDIESEIIVSTQRLLAMGVVDIDHQLNNFLVDRNGAVHRIDFECAQRRRIYRSLRSARITMLARLISSHIYVAQPDVPRSLSFTKRLYQALEPGRRDRERIQRAVNENLERQYQRKGVFTSITLPD